MKMKYNNVFRKLGLATIIILLIANLFVGFYSISLIKNNKNQVIKRNITSVVELKAIDNNKESFGTAVLISKEGFFITNAHVVTYSINGSVQQFEKYYIRFSNQEEFIEVKLEKSDLELDLALLSIDKPQIENVKPLKFSDNKLELGQDIFSIGNGLNHGLSISVGVVSIPLIRMTYNDNIRSVIQLDLTINDGNSGGPVFNIKGEIVGIISFRLRDNSGQVVYGIAYAIPVSVIDGFIKDL